VIFWGGWEQKEKSLRIMRAVVHLAQGSARRIGLTGVAGGVQIALVAGR
jgi:hypothetical protein